MVSPIPGNLDDGSIEVLPDYFVGTKISLISSVRRWRRHQV